MTRLLAPPRFTRWSVTSIALHLAILAVLVWHRQVWIAPMKLPGDASGHRLTLTYTPGHVAPQSSLAAVHPLRMKPVVSPLASPVKVVTQAAAAAAPPGTSANSAAQGTDALGSGNVTVALATYFPRPAPELPLHTHGDVVVDVVIDETGKITTTHITQSLAPAIDQTVLATIQTWTFKPATKDGVAVPSEQELLFHYDRA